jgi:hypothetical protein
MLNCTKPLQPSPAVARENTLSPRSGANNLYNCLHTGAHDIYKLSSPVIRRTHARRHLGVALAVRRRLILQPFHRALILLRLHMRRQRLSTDESASRSRGVKLPDIFITLYFIRLLDELERRRARFSRGRVGELRVVRLKHNIRVCRAHKQRPSRRFTQVRLGVSSFGFTFNFGTFLRTHVSR